ncbi:unnamed protein product [Pleuronectes platessa]|uniref:Uncharacterized protein n=1 Tax=Pleuronectes platessa TaxID=8262 RepID=A0A9N7VJE8_PLEPL|nr:unnamed protein product [Pleuronectes platessa]
MESGHSFNVTRFSKETLNLPLFLPVNHTHLNFTPTRYPNESSMGPFDPKHPRGPVQLIREGQISDYDVRYRGLISLGRKGTINEVFIARLSSRHDGLYEIRDGDGNLVSSTFLQVIEKGDIWEVVLGALKALSGMLASLACLMMFISRFPICNRMPRVNIQDYSQTISEPSSYYSQSQQPGTPREWTPRASPNHTSYTPVRSETQRAENQGTHSLTAEISPRRISTTEKNTSNEEARRISFSVAGASDCLHSSEDCVQFQIKTDGDRERWSKSQQYFSTMPLDTNTSESCSVYTSDKLSFS